MAAEQNPTRIAQALGLTRGIKLWTRGAPAALDEAIDAGAGDIERLASPSAGMDLAIVVIAPDAAIDRELQALSGLLQPAGHVWLLWEEPVDVARVAAVARDSGFVAGDVHRIADRWEGIRLDPAPAKAD